jgi:uncharacterized protein (UPF0276 family)
MTAEISEIPYLGVGLGLRKELSSQILSNKNEIDVLEITSEHFMDKPEAQMQYLKKFRDEFSVVPHGLNLSIGSAIELDREYLKKIKKICETIAAPYYSDHFATTYLPGLNIGHLSPAWFTKEALNMVIKKIDIVQNFLGIPLVLENITSFFDIPEADFEEPEFISEVCRKTQCGLLLDITNVHINAHNRGQDPYNFLQRLPLMNVVHVHLAGGKINPKNNWYYDTHSEELNGVNEGVWPLLKWVAERTNIKTVIIERDDNFKEDFNKMILDDIKKARSILIQSKKSGAVMH